jgi:Na+-transporting methylmalonyl-CoA/oxaloacetate decarboxylase gamma subunit
MGLEQAAAEDAAILTAIGIGTAFSVLLLLLVVTLLIRRISDWLAGPTIEPAEGAPGQPAQEDAQARNRALAAALAVTALLAARVSGGDRGQGPV